MARKDRSNQPNGADNGGLLAVFACPNPDCDDFNRFDAGNLSVVEWTGRRKHIRRLYCRGYGCSLEATADICEVDPRTVEQFLEKAGRRAEDFHRLQLEKATNAAGPAYSQRLSRRAMAAVGVVAVARSVQLDARTSFAERANPRHGIGPDRSTLVGAGVHPISGSCQRPAARGLD